MQKQTGQHLQKSVTCSSLESQLIETKLESLQNYLKMSQLIPTKQAKKNPTCVYLLVITHIFSPEPTLLPCHQFQITLKNANKAIVLG